MREMKNSGIEWIGEIPKDKELRRTKYDLSFIKGKIPTNINNEKIGTPYIGASNLDCNEEYDVFTTDNDLPSSEHNDTLILWDGARAGLVGTGHKGFISSTIMKVSPINDKIDKEFFYWYCKGFEWYFYMKVNGTTIPHMNRDYIYDIGLIEFNKEEQHLIAEYLDKKCSKIDEIISKQQTIIEKLKEYKLSIITEAVIKGLNPDVTMKDSGVEWIGEIPEHWKITKIKHKAILNPKCDFSHISYDTLITYTPMECVKNGYYNNRTEILSKIPSSLTPFEEGDIVMAKVTPCFENGNIAIMNNLQSKVGLGSSELFVFRSKGILTKYLFYFLQSINFTRQACLTMTGAGGLKRVSSEFCKNCKLPLPPYIEQKQIADYLDSKCEKIDFTINKKQKLIDKLTEYKKSLIYEVVTGKKEV